MRHWTQWITTKWHACIYIKWYTTCMPSGDHACSYIYYISGRYVSVERFQFNTNLQHPCNISLRVIKIIVFLLCYFLLVLLLSSFFEIDIVFEALVITVSKTQVENLTFVFIVKECKSVNTLSLLWV